MEAFAQCSDYLICGDLRIDVDYGYQRRPVEIVVCQLDLVDRYLRRRILYEGHAEFLYRVVAALGPRKTCPDHGWDCDCASAVVVAALQ